MNRLRRQNVMLMIGFMLLSRRKWGVSGDIAIRLSRVFRRKSRSFPLLILPHLLFSLGSPAASTQISHFVLSVGVLVHLQRRRRLAHGHTEEGSKLQQSERRGDKASGRPFEADPCQSVAEILAFT